MLCGKCHGDSCIIKIDMRNNLSELMPSVEEALDLYNQGYSLEAIGKHYGVSRQRVHQKLSAHPNYQSRSLSAARKREKNFLPLSTISVKIEQKNCSICGRKLALRPDRTKRSECRRCWLKFTPEGKAYQCENTRRSQKKVSIPDRGLC